MTRVLVAGWIGSTNLGDELIHRGLRRHLSALGVDVTAISVDPTATISSFGPSAIRHRHPLDIAELWRAAGEADLLVVGGGGLIQDQSSIWNLPFHLQRVILARRRRLPWMGIGLGVDALRHDLSRRLARQVLPTASVFGVRDPASATAATLHGVGAPIVAADLAMGLDAPERDAEDVLIVSLRAPVRPGLGTAARQSAAGVDEGFVAHAASMVDTVAGRLGLPVRFVALQHDRDGPLHRAVAERLSATSESLFPTIDDVVHHLAGGRLMVTMRYHGALGALLAGTPAVVLDYSPKMSHLAGEVGEGFQARRPTAAADVIAEAAERALAHAHQIADARADVQAREATHRSLLEQALS